MSKAEDLFGDEILFIQIMIRKKNKIVTGRDL